ncbi:hypothetical protein MN086_01550 [Sulfurovum sp. XGS-02]|uniref:hypothetical protein n=1 Tax=Sulfurovum sp. XGS-02 TaxID=2925411 RepID=UPI00204B6F20|nr:hypothetical protein [Sulfurovum sp. XGS-02]UPT77844.1 hypothetical protein MN086_01550 [Sulfurovum sp. XGS-02]
MTINLLQTPEYRALMQSHIYKTIQYLFDKDQEFALACEVKYITFTPELPADIKGSFDDTVLFILSGFTFESAKLDEAYFTFEAGFGSDNFGSTVSLPLLAIKQLFVGDNPIIINFAQPVIEQEKKKEASASKKSSMEALLKNPENKKLLKNKK